MSIFCLRVFQSLIVTLVLIILAGCGLANRKEGRSTTPEMRETLEEGKGDAYSFKVRIFREGKKNTVNFDLYYNRDSLAMFAKGYLGKGVLKGLIAEDSVLAYFPTENEYYYGKIHRLVNNDCFERLQFEQLILKLFVKLPTELEISMEGYYLKIEEDSGDRKKYRLISSRCGEELYIEYDVEEDRFIPEKIEYEKGDGTFKLIAERTRRKLNVSIPADRFEIPIPGDALQIIL